MTKGFGVFKRQLAAIDGKIDNAISDVLNRYAQIILNDALAALPPGSAGVKSSFRIEISENGRRATIYTEKELAAYVEFGTGDYAVAYLSGKPQEMVDEAIKFYVNGQGKMEAQPYLFPAFYRHRDSIVIELDKRIQKIFDAA